MPAMVQGDVDLYITSDPRPLKGIEYVPLFRYEMQIALAVNHPLADRAYLLPEDLAEQTLITYPVERERLDVFQQFLDPAGVTPAAVRHSELTSVLVQLAARRRGRGGR